MAEPLLFELEGWPGGFNRSIDETALLQEELLDAVNVVVDARGDVASRKGYSVSTASGTPVQLSTIDSWWPNDTSTEILVGRSAHTDFIYVGRGGSPFAIDIVAAGAAAGSYASPTIDYFTSSFVSLNSDTELYVVNRRGSDPVYKLTWVDDATAPTAAAVTPAAMLMAEVVPDSESGTLTISATGGTYGIGAIGDMVEVAYNLSSGGVRERLRALDSFSSTLTTEGAYPNHVIHLSLADPTIQTDSTNLTGGSGTATYTKTSSQVEPDDQFPLARFALVKHSRVWAAHVKVGSTTHASRVYYSDLLKPEKWYDLQYFDFDPNDGSEITALVPYGEAILVFKNHNVYILTGKTEESYAITILDEAVGTTSPKSIATIGAQMLVFDRDHGVWSFDGAQFVNVAEQIQDYLLDGINYDYAFTASGFMRRGVYYLSVPWGTSKTPNRTFCYDLAGNLWYEWTYGFNQAAQTGGDTFAAVDGVIGFPELFDGVTDAGTAIDSYMTTGWLAPGGDGSQHRIRRLDASFADEGAAQAVSVTAYDDYSSTLFKTETVTPDGTALFQRIGGFGNVRWKQMKLKIASVSGSVWRINRLSMRLTVARRGRGVDSPNG